MIIYISTIFRRNLNGNTEIRQSTSGADRDPGRQPDQPSCQAKRDELHASLDRGCTLTAGITQNATRYWSGMKIWVAFQIKLGFYLQ